MADLFEERRRRNREAALPLPVRMRPRTLDEFVGQQHFIGEGKLLRRMLTSDRLSSAIFYGPAGTGKTTLAHVIASMTRAHFAEAHAAEVGVKQIREILGAARRRLEDEQRRTVLFIDELHRFNRAQQDVLLGDVEDGIVTLIGATTENPFFAVNSPLMSRSQVFQFRPLSEDDIRGLIRRALRDEERGLGRYGADLTDEAVDHLARICDGDARRALLALEVAVLSQVKRAGSGEHVVVDLAAAEDSIQQKAIQYDGTGDAHYDAISAFIKSMRGSDPDAAVYWLAHMLEAGEDPRFIARRVVIAAAEDIGNADPMALVLAQAAADATQLVGLPECQLPLAQAAIYLACAPKSNASAMAVWTAGKDVREGRTIPVPVQLRDAHYPGAKRLGAGEGYEYPHDHADGMVAQDYLGVEKEYYVPTGRGQEAKMAAYLEKFRQLRTSGGAAPGAGAPGNDRTRHDRLSEQVRASVKKQLRQRLRKLLADIPYDEVRAKSARACEKLVKQPEYTKAEVVMVFFSLPTEVDTTAIVLRAWQDGKRVLAPKVSWEQRRMMPVEVRSLTQDLTVTSLGIREPATGPPFPIQHIDLVLVPGLGFDEQGNRLGRGRGFYDRFLAHPQFAGTSCALALEAQMIESVPAESLDVRVNMLVTERKVRRFGAVK